MSELLLYGAYGYTGSLIAETAVERGWTPILAGRDERRLDRLATALDCPSRAFAVSDASAVESALSEVDVLLNCAGPFVETYRPLVDACIETGTHYLDITGEIDVFQGAVEDGDAATDAGVMVLPGVGFDVVPTDCLAAHLAERLPSATHLALGFEAQTAVSRGTAKTALQYLDGGGFVRREGRLQRVPTAYKTRRIDFGRGDRTAVTIPWGDVVTAFHTTGIPNVEVYVALPEPAVWAMRGSRWLAPVLGSPPVKSILESFVEATVTGPSQRQRERGRSHLWGEAIDDEGERVVSRMETPEAYALTVETAIETARRACDGDAPPGYQTPAGAYGPGLVSQIDGIKRVDVQ